MCTYNYSKIIKEDKHEKRLSTELFGVSLDSINTERPNLKRFSHRVSRRSPGRDAAAELHWAGLLNPGPTPLKTAMRGEIHHRLRRPLFLRLGILLTALLLFPLCSPLFSLFLSHFQQIRIKIVTQYGCRTSKARIARLRGVLPCA